MEDKRIDMLIEMTQSLQADMTDLKVSIAEMKTEKKTETRIWGGLGTWVNSAFMVLLGAYFEWKFNRLN